MLQILGVELALLGSFAGLAVAGVDSHVVFGIYLVATLVTFVLGPGMRGPFWGSVRRAGTMLLPSFFMMVPGALFYLEVVKWHHHRELARFCYDLPMSGWSALWFFVGPLLLVRGASVSGQSPSRRTMIAIHVAHAIVWMAATFHAWGCAMTV